MTEKVTAEMAKDAAKVKGAPAKTAIFCVGNALMLDDGAGPAVYEELTKTYRFPDYVDLFDVGCMSMELVSAVDTYDYLISIDALDNTGEKPGTVFEYAPDDMARRAHAMASLHDLKLVDLFDAAELLGYHALGTCFGIQVENSSPALATIGLTKDVNDAIPLLIDAVLADLYRRGIEVTCVLTGEKVTRGWQHAAVRSLLASDSERVCEGKADGESEGNDGAL